MPAPTRRLATLMIAAAVASCGRSGERPDIPRDSIEPEGGFPEVVGDLRPLVARITDVDTERTPGGLIVRAFADPGGDGYWDPDLVDVTPEGSDVEAITLEFRAFPPPNPAGGAPGPRRALDAATFLSAAEMRGKRRIEVVGATGARTLGL